MSHFEEKKFQNLKINCFNMVNIHYSSECGSKKKKTKYFLNIKFYAMIRHFIKDSLAMAVREKESEKERGRLRRRKRERISKRKRGKIYSERKRKRERERD